MAPPSSPAAGPRAVLSSIISTFRRSRYLKLVVIGLFLLLVTELLQHSVSPVRLGLLRSLFLTKSFCEGDFQTMVPDLLTVYHVFEDTRGTRFPTRIRTRECRWADC